MNATGARRARLRPGRRATGRIAAAGFDVVDAPEGSSVRRRR